MAAPERTAEGSDWPNRTAFTLFVTQSDTCDRTGVSHQ